MASIWDRGILISVFGESYSKAIGVVIDNFPFGIKIDLEYIKKDLKSRAPSKEKYGSTLRAEPDEFEILSGLYNGYSTGAPIAAIIYNKTIDKEIVEKIRPSHVDYVAKLRYNFFNDPAGGGHLSGRLTAALTFAGSVCAQALKIKNIKTFAHIYSIGEVFDLEMEDFGFNFNEFYKLKEKPIAVLDDRKIKLMQKEIDSAKKEGDSLGGIVECCCFGIPAGVGSPIFDGFENYISGLIFSVPAVKGIEFGKGFEFGKMRGSKANDEFYIEKGFVRTKTNNNGGILGGISTGMPLIFKVVFKPTPTISKKQNTVDVTLTKNEIIYSDRARDISVAVRGVFAVEAVCNIAVLSQLIYQGVYFKI